MYKAPAFLVQIKRHSASCRRLTAAWIVWAGATLICYAEEPTTPPPPVAAVARDNRFDRPESTIRHFRNAVSERHWRDEYECYSDRLKARFTYHVMICTREISDSEDLAAKVERAFQKFRIPDGLLDRFPSMRTTVLTTRSSAASEHVERQRDLEMKAFERESLRRIEIWAAEVYSLDIHWAGLIDELQPLFLENFRRHIGEAIHPSQTGIVWHLDYHTFNRVRDLQTDDVRSEGMIVARVRDPPLVVEQEVTPGTETGKSSWKSNLLGLKELISTDAWQKRGTRPAAKISLVRLTDGWKIDAVPYR